MYICFKSWGVLTNFRGRQAMMLLKCSLWFTLFTHCHYHVLPLIPFPCQTNLIPENCFLLIKQLKVESLAVLTFQTLSLRISFEYLLPSLPHSLTFLLNYLFPLPFKQGTTTCSVNWSLPDPVWLSYLLGPFYSDNVWLYLLWGARFKSTWGV